MLLSEYMGNGCAQLVGPNYTVRRYTDQIYKIVRFVSTSPRVGVPRKRNDKADPDRPIDLHSSISRAKRVILELALCNEWDYFCTFTLSSRYDRFDLQKWYTQFSQFIRDQRKKHSCDLVFLLVPETHKDGAWHIHGLMRGVPPLVTFQSRWDAGERIKYSLVKGGYSCWLDYEKRFGFNSFGPIHNPVACGFYITKYVSKAIDEGCINSGAHRYYASLGLQRSTKQGDIYGPCPYLDKFLVNHYEFCSTGMTKVLDGCDWTFAQEYMDHPPALEAYDLAEPDEIDRETFESFFDFIQEEIDGFR